MIVNFKCPNCGSKELDEVMTSVTQSSTVTHIEALDSGKDAAIDYGETAYDGGEVDSYICARCGWTLPGMEDLNGCGGDNLGLYEWLKEQGMLEYE